jgi:tagaturonate epimerase
MLLALALAPESSETGGGMRPTVLGLRKSFGFGDRLGLATPGHVAAAEKSDFAAIFAQQSIREMTRTDRTPQEVMLAAQKHLDSIRYAKPWGADADHLKTPEDVRRTAAAGFCFFTIDPSEHVSNRADFMTFAELEAAVAELEAAKIFGERDWREFYLNQKFEVSERLILQFTKEHLYRAAVKYGRAIAHSETMGRHIAEANAGRAFEIEISVDETDSPTSALEHLFFGLELKQRNVPSVVSLAPRFIGEFEKGIDYRGDLKGFESSLRDHVGIAHHCGPYKLSVHSGSDKFSIYPIVGRVCGDLLHVKTAGTSYLEALRVVARTAPDLFAEIAADCRGRFETDRKSYHISTTLDQVNSLPRFSGKADESVYLDQIPGRQLLHVTFGSVLTMGKDARGRSFKHGILDELQSHSDLHEELLEKHFIKHLTLLNKG